MKKFILIGVLLIVSVVARASYLMVPMDQAQKNHLKAYGIAYWILENDIEVDWLLNYRGGKLHV